MNHRIYSGTQLAPNTHSGILNLFFLLSLLSPWLLRIGRACDGTNQRCSMATLGLLLVCSWPALGLLWAAPGLLLEHEMEIAIRSGEFQSNLLRSQTKSITGLQKPTLSSRWIRGWGIPHGPHIQVRTSSYINHIFLMYR